MLLGRDPEGHEAHQLERVVDLRRASVLEIGCGDGRLTAHYAPLAKRIVGVDYAQKTLTDARRAKEKDPRLERAAFLRATAPYLPLASQSFDVVLFARSL